MKVRTAATGRSRGPELSYNHSKFFTHFSLSSYPFYKLLFPSLSRITVFGYAGVSAGLLHKPAKYLSYPLAHLLIGASSSCTLNSLRMLVTPIESYDQLNEALAGTDHSWTAFTLELCTALETANKLIQATSSHVGLLSEKVGELERVIRRGDSAIAAAKAVHNSLSQKEGLVSSRVEKQGL